MVLFWKKKKTEENIDAEVADIEGDFPSDIPPPPAAPAFIKKRLDEHPEDLIDAPMPPPPALSAEEVVPEQHKHEEIPKLFDDGFPEAAPQDEIKEAIEEVKAAPPPKPTKIYLQQETVTMEDIEKEFEDPKIEQPQPEDFFSGEPIPEDAPLNEEEFELPEFEKKEQELPDFESPFTQEERPVRIAAPSNADGEIFIRLDDYQKVGPKIKELQSELNKTIRTLNTEVNIENTQLDILGKFNTTLDQVQEKMMEIDGLMFKEE